MNNREKFNRLVSRLQGEHHGFFERPHLGRRRFFTDVMSGVAGTYLSGVAASAEVTRAGSVSPKNTAKNVIFIFLRGAPSHVDTFDFKFQDGLTPEDFAPETFGEVTLPMGLLGNTSRVVDQLTIIRSGLAWARAHPLAQGWMQVGRNPTSATGRIAPHIGSVVAIEKEPERRPGQVFPPFIALHARRVSGAGYFPTAYGPFVTEPNQEGLVSASHLDGRQVFQKRWALLNEAEGAFRSKGHAGFGRQVKGMAEMYKDARQLMFNPAVEGAFEFSDEESARYGATPFGNAVLTARKIIEQDQGTRFIQIDSDGWDHHADIYEPRADQSLYRQTAEFDPAFASLIEDLKFSGRLAETLVVACGEFGRGPGPLSSSRNGRDHYQQMFYVLAGGGISAGKVIGATNDRGGRGPGSFTTETGWSRNRDIRPEDMEATIYSALGIDWTTIRRDDPLGRGFYYVPLAEHDAYAPVDELWA